MSAADSLGELSLDNSNDEIVVEQPSQTKSKTRKMAPKKDTQKKATKPAQKKAKTSKDKVKDTIQTFIPNEQQDRFKKASMKAFFNAYFRNEVKIVLPSTSEKKELKRPTVDLTSIPVVNKFRTELVGRNMKTIKDVLISPYMSAYFAYDAIKDENDKPKPSFSEFLDGFGIHSQKMNLREIVEEMSKFLTVGPHIYMKIYNLLFAPHVRDHKMREIGGDKKEIQRIIYAIYLQRAPEHLPEVLKMKIENKLNTTELLKKLYTTILPQYDELIQKEDKYKILAKEGKIQKILNDMKHPSLSTALWKVPDYFEDAKKKFEENKDDEKAKEEFKIAKEKYEEEKDKKLFGWIPTKEDKEAWTDNDKKEKKERTDLLKEIVSKIYVELKSAKDVIEGVDLIKDDVDCDDLLKQTNDLIDKFTAVKAEIDKISERMKKLSQTEKLNQNFTYALAIFVKAHSIFVAEEGSTNKKNALVIALDNLKKRYGVISIKSNPFRRELLDICKGSIKETACFDLAKKYKDVFEHLASPKGQDPYNPDAYSELGKYVYYGWNSTQALAKINKPCRIALGLAIFMYIRGEIEKIRSKYDNNNNLTIELVF